MAADPVGTIGGNISSVSLVSNVSYDSSWHGVSGNVSPTGFFPVSIDATPGNVTRFTISTGSSACTNGYKTLNILFSNSSQPISALFLGSMPDLDRFIGNAEQNGSATFRHNSTFATASYGTIQYVPTAYTEPAAAQDFPMGYLQDQSGNLVFITPVVVQKPGFDGSNVDFQAMLPTRNGLSVTYYAGIDLACNPAPPAPPSPGTGGGGGGAGKAGAGQGSSNYGGTWPPVDISVDIGYGITCIVNARRSISSSNDFTVVTTTLTDSETEGCQLSNFAFIDDIPPEFGTVDGIIFSPDYFFAKDSTVVFIFPEFSPGESRTIVYTIPKNVPVSKLSSFKTMRVSADKIVAPSPSQGGNPPSGSSAGAANASGAANVSSAPCSQEIYCSNWSNCDDGLRMQRCKDFSGCTSFDVRRVEDCGANATISQQNAQGVCAAFPALCTSASPNPTIAFLFSFLLILTFELAVLTYRFLTSARKKRKHRNPEYENGRQP